MARRLNPIHCLPGKMDAVTGAAAVWDFRGSSQEYKKLFGELPSDAMRRYHGS
jgi:hypothetical protein